MPTFCWIDQLPAGLASRVLDPMINDISATAKISKAIPALTN
jgi:hypothetical protein